MTIWKAASPAEPMNWQCTECGHDAFEFNVNSANIRCARCHHGSGIAKFPIVWDNMKYEPDGSVVPVPVKSIDQRVSDDRLREITDGGTYGVIEGRELAEELLNARNLLRAAVAPAQPPAPTVNEADQLLLTKQHDEIEQLKAQIGDIKAAEIECFREALFERLSEIDDDMDEEYFVARAALFKVFVWAQTYGKL